MPDTYGGRTYGGGEYAGSPSATSPVEVDGGNFPTILVECAFGYNPGDTGMVWVNIASDVTQIGTRRGRQRLLNKFEAGTMTVTLDNKSGKYSPFNASSPYANQLKPGTPIRFRAIWGATTFTRYTGFVEAWPLVWDSASSSTVTINAVDNMKFLNLKIPTSIGTYAATVKADNPYLWYRCNDPTGSNALANSTTVNLPLPILFRTGWPFLSGQPATILYNPTFQAEGALVADTDAAVDLATGSAIFTSPLPSTILRTSAQSIEVWAKVTDSPQSAGTSSDTPGYATIAGLVDSLGQSGYEIQIDSHGSVQSSGTSVVGGGYPPAVAQIDDHNWHHLVLTYSGGTLSLWVDAVLVRTDTYTHANDMYAVVVGGEYTGFPVTALGIFAGLVDEVAIYTYALSQSQIAAHYLAGRQPRVNETTGQRIAYLASYTGIPASSQSIATGTTLVQGATDEWLKKSVLAQMQDQADTEGGNLFIDASGNLTFFDRYRTSRSPYSSVSLVLGDSGVSPEEPYRLDSLTVSYDDQDIVNEVTITPQKLSPQVASVTSSQTQYGKRTMSRSSLAYDAQDALDQATYFANTLSTALPRIDSVTVVPTDDPTMLFGPVLGSDLLTRVELIRRPKDGSGSMFDQTALIEGIQDRVTKGTWQTAWQLSSTDAIKMMIFGETNFGEGVFAY